MSTTTMETPYDLPVPNAPEGPTQPAHLIVEGQSDLTVEYCHGVLTRETTPATCRAFERGGALVRVATYEHDVDHGGIRRSKGSVAIRSAERGFLLHALAKHGRFEKPRKKGAVPCDPPTFVAERLQSTVGVLQYPALRGVATCPTIRPDGSIFDEPGYDHATGTFMQSSVDVSVPDNPTRQDAIDALDKLKSLLREFPFEKPEEHKSVALALLLTSVARPSIPVAPLFVVSAPTRGTGKSTLVNLAGALALGRPAPAIAAVQNAEEFRKRIDTVLLAGDPVVNIDNVNWPLRSATLAQATSEKYINVRPLGVSEQRTIENTALFIANGNNISVAEDLSRRVLICRLDANTERPESRKFKGDPIAYCIERRADFVSAALTVLRAYIVAVAQDKTAAPDMTPWNGFDAWSKMVRAPLVWLGESDPCLTTGEAVADDPEGEARAAVFEAWHGQYRDEKRTLTQVLDDCSRSCESSLALALRAATAPKGDSLDRNAIGLWLRSNKGCISNKLKLENVPSRKVSARWFVREIT